MSDIDLSSDVKFVACPACSKKKLEIGQGEPTCGACGWSASYTEAANAYATRANPGWRHPRHGTDDVVAKCNHCDMESVVPVGKELGAEVRKAQAKWPDYEYYPDATFSVCLSCGVVLDDAWKSSCSNCGTDFFSGEDSPALCDDCMEYKLSQ